MNVDLSVEIGGLRLKNPVLTASGTFGYGIEFADYLDLSRLGGIVTKGLSLLPRRGNPPPRIVETPSGLLNAIGLENVGLENFARDILPALAKTGTRVIVNFFGDSVEEYAQMAAELDGLGGVDALELNISCPNVKAGGMAFGTRPESAAAVTAAVRARTGKTLIVKLSPACDAVAVARAVAGAGADAVSCMNTIPAMAIDPATRRPRLANVTGGLSGPAVRPVAVKMTFDVARAVTIPVVGVGGIMSGDDALEFVMAGASGVEVGTANFTDPCAAVRVLDGIEAYCARHRVREYRTLIGSLLTDGAPTSCG
ncbi:MAG: dihydroorotate dehydrogenase [Deltaproteobacteria bacterium]|nr:dihydroorotate dehydrogenase [Deltaproteobacteria bacterium]